MISSGSLRSEGAARPWSPALRALFINSVSSQGAEMLQPLEFPARFVLLHARRGGEPKGEARRCPGCCPPARGGRAGLARLRKALALSKGFVENGACRGGGCQGDECARNCSSLPGCPLQNVRDERPRYAPGLCFFDCVFSPPSNPPLNLCLYVCPSDFCSWMRRRVPWPFWHKLARK